MEEKIKILREFFDKHFEVLEIDIDEFRFGDIILNSAHSNLYKIIRVVRCACPCNKVRYIRGKYLMSDDVNKFDRSEICGKRIVLRLR